MLRALALSAALLLAPLSATAGSGPSAGLVTVPGTQDVPTTVTTLKQILGAKGLTLVAEIDHAAAAEAAGLSLRPTVVLVFGNPAVGTPMMQAAPTAALDLPLKVLVYRDDAGTTQLAYNDPAWLALRHSAIDVPTLGTMRKALPGIVQAAAAGEAPATP